MEIPDHLTYLLPNLYAGQWTGSKLGKEYVLSPCLFNVYAEYIMQNTRTDQAQAGIKVVGRNINKLRYLIESEEELRSLLMKVKEEGEKAGLKLNIHNMKIMASGPITPWQIDGETMERVTDYFLGLQNYCRQ